MKLIIITVALVAMFVPENPQTMNCQILDGKTAIEAGLATRAEIEQGDIPLRCVKADGGVMYYTVPSDEYVWRGCRSARFKLPEMFFAITKDAKFVTDNCSIVQTQECDAYEMSIAKCGDRWAVNSKPCRPPR